MTRCNAQREIADQRFIRFAVAKHNIAEFQGASSRRSLFVRHGYFCTVRWLDWQRQWIARVTEDIVNARHSGVQCLNFLSKRCKFQHRSHGNNQDGLKSQQRTNGDVSLHDLPAAKGQNNGRNQE